MFGKIMYYDKKTIDEYKALIKGQRHLEIEEYEVSNDKGAGFDLKAVSVDTKASKKYTARVVESMLYDCAEFEKMLSGRDDYFDFTQSNGLDLLTVPRGSIIKVDAFLEIPESFDLMQVIDRFKPLFMDSINTDSIEQSGKDALNAFLGNATATRIPIIGEVDDWLLCAKMHQENLVAEYEEFEEIDEQVTVLARVSSGVVDSNKPFYDPLKDFMTMNRMMRRNMKDRGEELKALTVDKAYRQIDILAIYK
jgi:hypothetical protein